MKITFSNGRSLVLNPAQIAFLLIASLTLLNGFVGALWYEFVDFGEWRHCTFLDYPPDLYGDLLKPSFASPPFVRADTSHWPRFIALYYTHNPYIQQNLQASSHVTGLSFLHVTPITLLAHVFIKKLVLMFSPQFVVALFFLAALTGVALLSSLMAPPGSVVGTFLVLAFSYPFLMILCRGNMGALVDGIMVPFYLYFILRRRNLWAAVACLILAALFRPNVLLLCPVLLGLGWRQAILGSLAAAAGLIAGYGLSFPLDRLLYPGYGLAAHLSGLRSYTTTYIVGSLGDGFNNSAYGAVKLLIRVFYGRDCSGLAGLLLTINLGLALAFGGVLLTVVYLYSRRRLPDLSFAFAVLTCFVLMTTIFATYHLFVFAVFPLLLLYVPANRPLLSADYLVLGVSVFVLVPKNYVFITGISVETLLNPLVLALALLWLIIAGFKSRFSAALGDEVQFMTPRT